MTLSNSPSNKSIPLFRQFHRTETDNGSPPLFRIISHNVFWFQGVPFRTDQPPPPNKEVLDELVSLYKNAKADVFCIQEVQDATSARILAEELGLYFIYTAGQEHSQYGGAILCRWPIEEIPLRRLAPVDRVIQKVRLHPEGRSPLTLTNIHLPSGRQRGPEGGQAQRLLEIPIAIGDSHRFSDRADIIVGDFNERPDGQCASLLKSNGFNDAAKLCGADEVTTTLGQRRIDQIWLSDWLTPNLITYFTVHLDLMQSNVDGKKFISDHLPIGVDLHITGQPDLP